MGTIISFGDWVRRRRKSLDLTQQALAYHAGCATVTIKKIERDERRPSQVMAERLADALSIPPGDRPAFLQSALGKRAFFHLPLPADPAIPPEVKAFSNHRSHAIPNINHRKEIAETSIPSRRRARLLTLMGIAGAGKSRKSAEVVRSLVANFPSGVFLIHLAYIHDPQLVVSKIAEILDINDMSGCLATNMQLEEVCNEKILLLLENFEHLLPAASLLAELLNATLG